MNPTVNQIVVEQMSRNLGNLKTVLKKAKSFAIERKFEDSHFLSLKLAPDMFPLVKQIQISCDTLKATCARLSGNTAPSFPDDEKTIDELISRIDKTLDYVRSYSTTDFAGYETKTITFPWYPGAHLKGADYLTSFAIPNFYFHVTTAYALIRTSGVHLGKGDFLGELNWQKVN